MAETAFEACSRGTSPDSDAQQAAFEQIRSLASTEESGPPLNSAEADEAAQLQNRLQLGLDFIRSKSELIEFRSKVEGCGVVQPASCDITQGDQLIEVKAVHRGFRSLDFRQLLTYAALGYANDRYFSSVCLLNPREAKYFRAGVSDIALDVGAGSWVELMQDLINEMTEGLAVSR